MGLFGKALGVAYNRAASVLYRSPWCPDGTGVTDGGDCGGDTSVGASYAVRFVRADLPGSLITVTFYPVKTCPSGFQTAQQIEWLVCTDPADPGGTEIWSDYSWDCPYVDVFDRLEDAQADACEAALQTLDLAWVYGDWDGRPW